MFNMPSGSEWLWIFLIVVILFGGAKLPQIGRSIGTAITEFKAGLKGKDDAEKKENDQPHST